MCKNLVLREKGFTGGDVAHLVEEGEIVNISIGNFSNLCKPDDKITDVEINNFRGLIETISTCFSMKNRSINSVFPPEKKKKVQGEEAKEAGSEKPIKKEESGEIFILFSEESGNLPSAVRVVQILKCCLERNSSIKFSFVKVTPVGVEKMDEHFMEFKRKEFGYAG